jgi:hypothetical protein
MKPTSLKTKILICVGVWLIFAGLAAFIGLKFTDWLTYRRLSNGISIYGRVVSKDPENHQIVRYSFVVGQQLFSGIGHGGRGNPAFNQLEIGQRVVVFYDPQDPSFSCMGYPESHQGVEMAGIIFLVLFVPLGPLAVTIIIMIVLSKSAPRITSAWSGLAGSGLLC